MEFIFPKFREGSWVRPICGVYKIIFDDKYFYIGSSVHLRRRIDQWHGAITGRPHYSKLYPAISQIISTVNKIRFEIVEDGLSRSTVRIIEDFYIKKSVGNPLFLNQSPSAFNNLGYKRLTQGNHTDMQAVKKFTKGGVFVCEYRSLTLAAKENGTWIGRIQEVVNGCRKSHKGFVYEVEGVVKRNILMGNRKRGRKVVQYTLDGSIVQSFDTIVEAAAKTKIGKSSIKDVINNRKERVCGFVFKYAAAPPVS